MRMPVEGRGEHVVPDGLPLRRAQRRSSSASNDCGTALIASWALMMMQRQDEKRQRESGREDRPPVGRGGIGQPEK